MPYVAFCSRTWFDREHDFQFSEDGKTLTVRPDQILARDDDALSATFVSHDETGKHEMMRSFLGQKVKITIEVED